ncbi:DUF4349 domain-containing protein [Oscillibacter sp.]|uniref:DUF4349 domain-containing protein n=1 Tax=Oscillibacter sp. TaxID=1945593 RepID=UPI0026029C51|nr:DUF4349 domain-containing protein [Oscillibacter sp.]MDD3346997.1 DUF4349 domain-containing protein [Oscillibacter sp.]
MKKKWLAGGLAALMLLGLTACGSKSSMSGMSMMTSDTAAAEAPAEPNGAEYGGGVAYEESQAGTDRAGEQKLIRRAELELETTAFDEAVQGLSDLTKQLGGYYESGSVGDRGSNYRWANYVVRVPAERYEDFLNQAGALCHEIWRSTSQEDVSEAYYDTAGRLKTQQIKLERLQELLKRAEKMEDIITIESAVSETEQAIDDLSGTLQHYDAQVDYATVNISLSEVYQLSNVPQAPTSFASRMAASFTDGWRAFVSGLESLAVGIAYGWMYLLVLAGVIAVTVRVVRRRKLHLPGIFHRHGKGPEDGAPKP